MRPGSSGSARDARSAVRRAMQGWGVLQHLLSDPAHCALLLLDRPAAVHHREPELVGHRLVLVDDALLKYLEALAHVVGEADVHPRFVILDPGAAGQDSI